MAVTYVVKDEHTLGYIYEDYPQWMGVLHGSVLKGGHDWRNGNVFITDTCTIRPATPADFNEYRVTRPPDMQPDYPGGWQTWRGISCNGEILAMRHLDSGEVAIWIWARGMHDWMVLERPLNIALADRRMDELHNQVFRCDPTIEGMALALVAGTLHPLYGIF